LKAQKVRYEETVAALGDPARTLLVLVARPDRVALLEAVRTSRELGAIGMQNQFLLVNGVFRASDPNDPLAIKLEERGRLALRALPPELSAIPSAEIPMHGYNVVGVEALRDFFRPASPAAVESSTIAVPAIDSLGALIEEIAAALHGLVMVMGKGGVGKTTIAASIAVSLARRGREVHLTTTDPAAHLGETLVSEVAGLKVSRIDAAEEYRRYCDDMLAQKRESLSPDELALLAEELRSPCYEEVAVFHAIARTVAPCSSSDSRPWRSRTRARARVRNEDSSRAIRRVRRSPRPVQRYALSLAGNQWRVRLQTAHTESITGTSTRTPTTVASAAPELGP
jgi:arsenite-transporting ATPase